MIVAALLTSVGINSALCILFFLFYSILRKQPINFKVFIPRLLADKRIQNSPHFRLRRLLPSPGWIREAWKFSEEDLLSTSGLDAVVFMRIITFSLRVFSFAGIVGLFILLPVNCAGAQLAAFDISKLSTETLEIFSISNVNNGSKWLWAHCSAVYAVTLFVCYLLYHEYSYISSKRIAYFLSSRPQPHQFTILVSGIPVPPGGSVSEKVNRFFMEYHPSTYISHVVIHRTKKIRTIFHDAKKLHERLILMRSEPSTKDFKHDADLERKLGDIEENLRMERSNSLLTGHEVQSAFVSFRSRYGAAVASNMQQSDKPTEWVTEQAPEPSDVYWPVFHSSFLGRWMSKVVIVVTCILLTVLFIVPVVIAQGLTNLSQLEVWFPFLESILATKVISQIITGYLPNLILQGFLKSVPHVMEFLSSIQGYISYSEIQRSACYKFLWFIVWNVFFANVLSGSVLNQLSILLDLSKIPAHLAVAVPAQASFFIAYVVTSGWTSTSSELFRVIPFLRSLLRKCCCCCCNRSADDVQVPYIDYHKDIPRILFFGLLGITYFFLAPLILPFLLVYFFLAYIIFKNQFMNVYGPKFETAGKFWPIVHNSMIFSLVLMHAIAVGIFALKKVHKASYLIFPLPILTLLFNEYCRKRFRPNFVAYSTESLIKKDREDANDLQMSEFYNQLVTAYQEPALYSLYYSSHSDAQRIPNHAGDHATPFLSNA